MLNLRSLARLLLTEEGRGIVLWKLTKKDNLRLDYALSQDSVVFDIGGYKGDWSKQIYLKYRCNIFIFEPIKEFAEKIRGVLPKSKRIKIYNFGLSNKTEIVSISVNRDSTSRFKNSGQETLCKFIDVATFIRQQKITNIDLMKINIEGEEYDLIMRLIDSNLIERIENVQVQFHSFVNNADQKMAKVQKALSKTHKPTYQYKFVWENWKKVTV